MNAQAAPNPTPTDDGTLKAIKDGVGSFLKKACFEEITQIRVPWPIMPQQQQQEFLDRLDAQIEHAVSIAVNQIISQGTDTVPVVIEKVAIKDVANAVIIVAGGGSAIGSVVERIGGKALLVFADPADYLGRMDAIKTQADQPDLPLEG